MNHWDRTGILIAILSLFPAITLYVVVRRQHSGTPTRARLAITRGYFVWAVFILACGSFAAWQTPRRLHAADYVALGLWLAQCILWAWLCRFVRRHAEQEAEAQGAPPRKQRRFLGQGLLILLPVAVMAGIGLFSLRQDRLLAEQDVGELGSSLARHLARVIGMEATRELQEYRNANGTFIADEQAIIGISGWAPGTDLNRVRAGIESWQRAHPGMPLAAMPVSDCSATIAGEFSTVSSPWEYLLSPLPPAWPLELNPEQQRLWRKVQTAEFVASDPENAQGVLEQFIALNPPKAARANAEYLLLRLKTRDLPPDKAAALFAESKWTRTPDLTDAGLPVGQLISYEVLRRSGDHAGFSNQFLKSISWAITYRPSVFSPILIAEAERVAGPAGSESAQGAAALRIWWDMQDKARQVLSDFRDQHPPGAWTDAPYWTTSADAAYLVWPGKIQYAQPPSLQSLADSTNSNHPFWRVSLFPKEVIDMAFAAGIAKGDVAIPSYAAVRLEIGRSEFEVTNGPGLKKSKAAALSVLGEATGELADSPVIGQVSPFRIRVYLDHPEILYARQRQRTLLFGGLILVSAIAALIGFLAARRAFYRQLHLSEMKSNFVSSVSHELRAPIASVRLMAEGLEQGRISELPKQREYFRFIVQECRRLSSLIENVLDFSRIEQGRKQYEFEPADAVALAQQTVKLMQTYAAEQSIELALQIQGEPFPVEMDAKAIQQALINLIDNAIKHSPKGGNISVGLEFRSAGLRPGTSSKDAAFLLWVEDHGEGIPAREHEKIFERFYRLGSELRRESQGVGIGLSIVKHILEAHGGRITVRSAPGEGSRFTIELPAGKGGK